MKKLLVVVDYQNDFVCGALGFAGAEILEPGIFTAVQNTLDEGGYVLFTRDTHGSDYLNTREGKHLPIPHCKNGTEGHALFGRLHQYEPAPPAHTKIIDKPLFGCADIGMHATALCGGTPEQIEICGLVTDICVLANAILLHTAFPHTEVRVLAPLCGSGNKENAQKALDLMAGMGIYIAF